MAASRETGTDLSLRETRQIARELGVDPGTGLGTAEAQRRLEADGPNELRGVPPVPAWRKFVSQFHNPLIYLLLAAVAVCLAGRRRRRAADRCHRDRRHRASQWILGYVQEARADDAVAALGAMTTTSNTALRGGELVTVPSAELVCGDILALSEGDAVGADARLLSASGLRIAEASLTGESEAVTKHPDTLPDVVSPGDRLNMVLMGTAMAQGVGRAIVTATGMNTEMGVLARMLDATVEEPTPLQTELNRLGKMLGLIVTVIAIVVMLTIILVNGVSTPRDLVVVLLLGVSLAVAAAPERLPAILSVVLAIGVQRMATRHAIVKKLNSVEALGSASVICTDKTGTLTRNEMTIERVLTAFGQADVTASGIAPTERFAASGTRSARPRPTPHCTTKPNWCLSVGRCLTTHSSPSVTGTGTFRAIRPKRPSSSPPISSRTPVRVQSPCRCSRHRSWSFRCRSSRLRSAPPRSTWRTGDGAWRWRRPCSGSMRFGRSRCGGSPSAERADQVVGARRLGPTAGPGDADADYALSIRLQHREAHSVDNDTVALPADPAESVEHESGDRLIGTIGQFHPGHGRELVEDESAIDLERPAALQGGIFRLPLVVVLVIDLTDELLHQVFHGDDPVGAAVLVEHESDLLVLAAHGRESIQHGNRSGKGQDRAHDVDERRPGVRPDLRFPALGDIRGARHHRHQVTGVHKSEHIVNRLPPHGKPGVRQFEAHTVSLCDREATGEKLHIRARTHHFDESTVTGAEHIGQDGPAVIPKARLAHDQFAHLIGRDRLGSPVRVVSEQAQHSIGGDGEQPDYRPHDAREHLESRGENASECHRMLQGEAFRHQFAEHE